uniref:Uncharacterized protein n=1 Tax=Cannabis sativa TaxID=3483 RepID=A0A803PSI2_CANSA
MAGKGKVLQALKKRSGDGSDQISPVKWPRVEGVPPKEKSFTESPIEISEEAVSEVDLPLAKKSSKSKSAKGGARTDPDRPSLQLVGGDEMSVELLMGGLLKEVTRKEVDATKKEAEYTRAKLGEKEWEVLEKEVKNLETAALEVCYEFWKANLNGIFDYLNKNKEAYLSYYVVQKDKEESEAVNPKAQTD